MPPLNEIPARINGTIHQGTDWNGLRLRFVDGDGAPETITVTAQVRTDTIDRGGRLLADCRITSQTAGWWLIDLAAAATALLPERSAYCEVHATRSLSPPVSVAVFKLDILGMIDVI